jgi:hypothetical protein
MSDHPYTRLPDKAFWSRSVAKLPADSVDPVDVFNLRIGPQTKVATAGSCFAQHIARHLRESGFNYYVAEPGHPILPLHIRQRHNYGVFSARYGNIYTARQLVQLLHRAYGRFRPAEEAWAGADGAILDPFRPAVQPGGFISGIEMLADREQHLAAVRTMFETLDVFVFTLGLTECWTSRIDGAAFPICPGVNGGTFDPARYAFHNQHVDEVVSDMSEFVEALKAVNGRAEMVLTVSPVPLAATAEPGAHVLSATTYSKSVLRVAAEHLRRRYMQVHYFPSYEIITGAFNRGRYYADDLRNVTEDGVSHVMRLFLHHATEGAAEKSKPPGRRSTEQIDDYAARAEHIVEVECDEIALDR